MEILSLIFRHTCPVGFPDSLKDDPRDSPEPVDEDSWQSETINRQPVSLSWVSSYWRHVALTTPQLWATVGLALSHRTVHRNVSLLQHHITLTGNLCISVVLSFEEGNAISLPNEQGQRMRAALTNTLFSSPNALKIGSLWVRCIPNDWLELLKYLPRLCALGINGNCEAFKTKLEVYTHTLHTLSLSMVDFERSLLKLPRTIRKLQLWGTSAELNHSLLQNCPNLIECQAFDVSGYWHSENWVPPRFFETPLTLTYLETFTWDICVGIADGSALKTLCLPRLKTLRLMSSHLGYDGGGLEDGVIPFIHKHSGTLCSLELEDFVHQHDDHWLDLLFQYAMPCLQTVRVTTPSFGCLVACIRALTPKAGESGSATMPAQALEFLLLKIDRNMCSEDGSDDEEDLEGALITGRLILEMLWARRAGEHSKFLVEVPVLGELGQEEKDGFRSLYLGRHRVTLTLGIDKLTSEIPDWLLSTPSMM
jgi:hypothetical protein